MDWPSLRRYSSVSFFRKPSVIAGQGSAYYGADAGWASPAALVRSNIDSRALLRRALILHFTPKLP